MFFPSPHNPPFVIDQLLDKTAASIFLWSGEHASIQEAVDMCNSESRITCKVPDLDYFLDTDPVNPVLFSQTMDDLRSRPFVLLHTSGTTGTPKSGALPHGYYIHEDLNQAPCFNGNITSKPFRTGARLLTSMSMWHVGGIFYGLLKPILNGIVTVMPPPGLPITADLLATCLKHSKADMVQAAPSLLAELVMSPENDSLISELKCFITGSGPMSETAGEKLLALNKNIYNYFGLTETDLVPQMPLSDPKDWQYQKFHPLSRVAFRIVGDGLYELIIVKVNDDGGPPPPCFEIYPGREIFHTKDLFASHPTEPDLWKWVCRLDDIITFATGEKMVAIVIEEKIMRNIEGVKGPLIFGQGMERPGLLLEVEDKEQEEAEKLVERVWPLIDEINSSLPAYGRIERDLIAITNEPFPRTPKGTVRRHEAQNIFGDQIQELYDKHDSKGFRGAALESSSEEHIIELITNIVLETLDVNLGVNDYIFDARGMDSLSMLEMVRLVNRSLQISSDPAIAKTKVYPSLFCSQGSVGKIAGVLGGMIRGKREETFKS